MGSTELTRFILFGFCRYDILSVNKLEVSPSARSLTLIEQIRKAQGESRRFANLVKLGVLLPGDDHRKLKLRVAGILSLQR